MRVNITRSVCRHKPFINFFRNQNYFERISEPCVQSSCLQNRFYKYWKIYTIPETAQFGPNWLIVCIIILSLLTEKIHSSTYSCVVRPTFIHVCVWAGDPDRFSFARHLIIFILQIIFKQLTVYLPTLFYTINQPYATSITI